MGFNIEDPASINNAFREAVYAGLSFNPGVGGVLGAVTNILWPDAHGLTAWETVRKDVEELANEPISKHPADELENKLAGFYEQYKNYEKATEHIATNQIHFESLRGDSARESSTYCRDSAPWETLPYFVGMCTFRLSIEKHYIDHFKELYPGSDREWTRLEVDCVSRGADHR